MKTAFLISGFNMNTTAADKRYAELRHAIEDQGYRVVPAPFVWNRRTVADYAKLFIDFYEKNKTEENIVIGNSYGAMVAFLSAPTTKPDRVLLCSLSPYFKEDFDKTTEAYRVKRFGKKRTDAQQYLSATDTAKQINEHNIPVTLLYGEQEKAIYPHLVARVNESAKQLKNSRIVEVPNAPHPFRDPAYVLGIAKELAAN